MTTTAPRVERLLIERGPLRRGALLAGLSANQRADLDSVLDRLVDEGLVTARAVPPRPRYLSVEYAWTGNAEADR